MIEKRRVLRTIELKKDANSIEVEWINESIENGVVVSSMPHRRAYGIDDKSDLIADVGVEADAVLITAGW